MTGGVQIRALGRDELARIREIDRTERIDLLYEQRGAELIARPGRWDAPAWDRDGDGEHSVAAQRRELERYVTAGGSVVGAFDGEQLVGIGVVVPHVRPDTAQLAYLHVTRTHRASGIGGRLVRALDDVARAAGDRVVVVSATPSGNTVRFYRRCGFAPMAHPLPELLEREPDDVHLSKAL